MLLAAILANLVVVLTVAVAAILHAVDPDLYYAAAQEDRYLEWLTFWAFAVAALLFVRNAIDERRRAEGLPWFAIGLAAFCAFVALEEISWGQRLAGYRPPDYFLERNYQQEFNLHNVVATDLRMAAMQIVLLGYGVLLSALSLLRAVRDWFLRLRIVASPPSLIPAFVAMSAVYAWYPLDYTGEWVECAMGLAFLSIAALTGDRRDPSRRLGTTALAAGALAGVTVLLLALVHGQAAGRSDMARREIALLVEDFAGPKLHTRCGIHKRLYTFMREYNQTYLVRGRFASHLRELDSAERANYLLDPWNSPYWVRHKCGDGKRVAFVYSLGPNRRRDSDEWAILGDDIGDYFISD